ncbi:PNK3P-domain-containing protein [Epithele typhae]|uniref:PNK3P-domain-containing protein n=1 Tax=Epithele typhae TaxID=378194 RepID=UPI0020083978|nr:PNK3P-domain-containing protein [Epithele typhae]KAH9946406.1 PNK3P-domain-containing protein [Epithele typhae]
MSSGSKQSSKKRSADHLDSATPGPSSKSQKRKSHSSHFRWILPSLGTKRSCLHGLSHEPRPSTKVAAFDLDGCLITSSFPKKGTPPTFEWWNKRVPAKLKDVHDQGYSVVIITNQALRTTALINDWKKKIPLIAAALPDVPFRIFAATEKDGYRKPMPGMWQELERIYAGDGVQIDLSESFFVGDAAGRKGDHSSTDRKLALNLRLPFYTPEEYFLGLQGAPYTLPGFNVSSLPAEEPLLEPSDPPLVPALSTPELVLLVGYPALGKSSFVRNHFDPAGYVHVNQDSLKTRDKCVKAAGEALQNKQSVVVDNTNRNVATRKYYLDLAKKHKVPTRCLIFTGSMELAWHNNLYRAFNLPPEQAASEPKRELLPFNAFTSFRAAYEEPTTDEGFTEVRRVNWVFEGDKEARRRWSMWLQIDGK